MEKIKTGVEGLDEMLDGGLVKGRPYLLCGGPGAGKTILATQFLLEGFKNGETVMYISLEETAKQLKEDMREFGWDLEEVEIIDTTQEIAEMKMFLRTDEFGSHPEFNLPNLIELLKRRIDCCDLQRIVIDSVSSVISLYESDAEARHGVMSLMNFISATCCTAMIIDELEPHHDGEVVMEEVLASGVIKIHTLERKGEVFHGISVEKMRGSDFDRHIRPVKITDKGVVVRAKDIIFE